jgi:hypothetical protein
LSNPVKYTKPLEKSVSFIPVQTNITKWLILYHSPCLLILLRDDGFTSFIGSYAAENPTHTRVSHDDSVLGNRREHFPFRLCSNAAADDELHSIASWSADGLSFSIHQKDIFIERIVPRYFKITKFRSFVSTISSAFKLTWYSKSLLTTRAF